MADENDEVLILDGQEMSLSELANLSYDETEEVSGFAKPPAGLFHLRVKKMGVTTYQAELDDEEGMETRGMVSIVHDILGVHSTVKEKERADAENLVGEEFTQNFFIRADEPHKAWGRAKKLLSVAGFKGQGTWGQIYEQVQGHEYMGAIKRTRNKKDPDNPHANLDETRTRPLPVQSVAQSA